VAVAAGDIRLDRSVSLDRLVASVTAVEGLGPWTAHYLALRIGERDACPITDLGVRRSLDQHSRPSAGTGELTDHWRPWRALAVTHLWLADGQRRPLDSSAAAA
jgi:AraC family transcriptional regulator, regulatory protein of adaptative response / DNA-3-methyladenine glycosylase II